MPAAVYSNLRSPRSVGISIRDARKLRGYAQLDLAEASGVSLRSLVQIESGRVNPRLETLIALLRVLDLELTFCPSAGAASGADQAEDAR